jgi:Insertion element 4 transposase N-terminal/Transposase DDE domain
MTQTDVVAGGSLTDLVSLGVLAAAVPRDVVDEAVAVTGKGARRAGGKLPPQVVVYLVMALALFADEDYEEVASRLTGALREWGEREWEVPTSGGITQARQRLGAEPLAEVFRRVAEPVAGLDTAGAFMAGWRLVSLDGMEWDVPDSPANRAAFGLRAGSEGEAAFPKVRVVTVSECGSHAPVLAALGGSAAGKGSGETSLARELYPRLEQGWLVLADRYFYCFGDWCAAAGTGADLLWRVKANTLLPVLQMLPDGSYRSVLIRPGTVGRQREEITAAARRGDLNEAVARYVRVVEYDVPDRDGDGELIVLVTTITDARAAPAAALAQAYHQRWEHETGNAQLKTSMRGPGRVLRSRSPDLAEQEIWGYLLAHYALSALICTAATAAGIDPDRVRFRRTLRIARRAVGPAFPP